MLTLYITILKSFWQDKITYIATKAKALFDYFYLKKMENIEQEIYDSRINWNNFSQDDLKEFESDPDSLNTNRTVNVVLHEIGHLIGLTHCENTNCLMISGGYLDDDSLCGHCAEELRGILAHGKKKQIYFSPF